MATLCFAWRKGYDHVLEKHMNRYRSIMNEERDHLQAIEMLGERAEMLRRKVFEQDSTYYKWIYLRSDRSLAGVV